MYYGYQRAREIRGAIPQLNHEIKTCEKKGNLSEAEALKDYKDYLYSVYDNVCSKTPEKRVKRYQKV